MYQVYEIMENETIDSLARKFETTKEELKRINKNTNFEKGSLIVVPNNQELYYKYIVKEGDTLYSISKLYGQDLDTLYLINGIKESDYIYPNQEIIIPKNNVNILIVKENDTLNDIANKMNLTKEQIIENNSNLYLLPDQLIIYKE